MATKSTKKSSAKKSSAKATKAKATPKKKGRGRPPLYTGQRLKHIETLVKRHGASGTMAILQADNRPEVYETDPGKDYLAEQTELIALRSVHLFPVDGACKITMPTILTIAKNAGITLQRGRRAAA